MAEQAEGIGIQDGEDDGATSTPVEYPLTVDYCDICTLPPEVGAS